jgi:ribonuclease HI
MTGNIRNKDKHLQENLFGELSENDLNDGYAVMYCDGASSGNPGHSGIGVVINIADDDAGLPEKNRKYEISEYIGVATNNVAEYSALIKGLQTAKKLGIRRINIFLDSELLVRQMNGIYKVNNLRDFDSCDISHVRREKNKEADALARQASIGKGLK